MKYLLLSLSLLLITSTACKKDNSSAGGQLPDTSSSGKNFLACKVNGKVQVYSGKGGYLSPESVSLSILPDRIVVFSDGTDPRDGVVIVVGNPSQRKTDTTYILSSESDNTYGEYNIDEMIPSLQYRTRNGSGWVRFSRLDSVASGTFEFTAYYDQLSSSRIDPDTVRITEGQFDISRK